LAIRIVGDSATRANLEDAINSPYE
jgi:hypothetical protein